jgi:hypothetical protein
MSSGFCLPVMGLFDRIYTVAARGAEQTGPLHLLSNLPQPTPRRPTLQAESVGVDTLLEECGAGTIAVPPICCEQSYKAELTASLIWIFLP